MRLNFWKNILPETNSQTTRELRHFIKDGAVLFDTDNKYPIWDESHREELNNKIYEHYALRQIGFETFGRFKFELNKRMREIMPYYIKIWKTTQYDYNPIENYSMEEEFKDNGSSEGTTSSEGTEKHSDTPMNDIQNLDDHITGAVRNDNSASTKGSSKSDHTGWRKGNIGVTTTQQMIEQERNATIDVDMMIIERLQDLFLGIY